MAYTSVQSGEIPEGAQYYSGKLPLGDYNFYLQYDATTATVVTRCDLPSGLRAATQRQLPAGAQLQQWRIEANETEASVYAITKGTTIIPVPCASTAGVQFGDPGDFLTTFSFDRGSGMMTFYVRNGGLAYTLLGASADAGAHIVAAPLGDGFSLSNSYTLNGQTVYFGTLQYGRSSGAGISSISPVADNIDPYGETAWGMVYGAYSGEMQSNLVARFQINIKDAGGYPGGGGGWISPGDWNPDPTTTLHLTVNGALSGRHNDPLDDQSFSYVPADKATVEGYGCGGDGGNGGGGGAGASTIIVRQFATNKANYKDIVALAKRHGYGSGGGKGGQGGAGCILIYY